MVEQRNYVVLGATGGIGSATCRQLYSAGAQLLLAGPTEASLAQLSSEVEGTYRVTDATSFEQVEALFQEAAERWKRIDGVVNCVGSLLLKPAHLTTFEQWEQTLATNLTSAFATVRSGAKAMRQDGGAIVLISSAAALTGLPNHEAIAAAKAGVIGLARSAAASYAARGIRVNAVAPGLIQTKMTEKIWSHEKSAEASRRMHALGRLGTAEDVASLIAWLLAPQNNWVTGQVFGVDGGLSSVRAMM